MKKSFAALILLALLGLPGIAHALVADCKVTNTPVTFGVYDPLSPSPLTANGTVTVGCDLIGVVSLLVAYTVDLSPGSSGVYTARTLKSGANTMNYNLFIDSAYTTVWGNNTGGSGRITDAYLLGLLNVQIPYTVYGRIPASQNVKAGTYTDSIIITVTF